MHSDPMAAYAYRWFGFLNPGIIDGIFSRFWDHMRFLGRSFDAVVSPGRELAERLKQRGLTNVSTIPLGVDGRFSPDKRDPVLREALLRELGLGPSANLFLSVGRLAPEKRPDLIVKAVGDAAAARELGLVVVGEGSMGRKLERLAAGSGRVAFLGHISDRNLLARLMASADGLIHACEAETFGLVLAEALASGTPVIVPDRGGAFEQLRPGAGLHYPAASRADLVEAIIKLVEQRADGRSRAWPLGSPRLMDDHFCELFGLYSGFSHAKAA
jgi:alpha-1,6-mannosyltransferase